MNWTRRDFLKAGSMCAAGLAVNGLSPSLFNNGLKAAAPSEDTKLIFIFQRGGNDAVNTVIPYGDPEYNNTHRPTLFIPESSAIDLGNGFAGLNPRMAPMMEIFNHSQLNGTDGPGNLALIHRVGYAGQSQSHFNSQQYWENGLPGDPSFEEGMIYRLVANTMDPSTNRIVAAALSGSQLVALKGELALPTIQNPDTYGFSGSEAKVQKFMGQLPSTNQGPDGKGLLGAYGGARDYPGKSYRALVYNTGLALADSMRIVQAAVEQGPYEPSGGAVYPTGSFGDKLKRAAMLLKRTPARVLGLNIGGWDTHTKQGQINGKHGNLLAQVAQGYQALYQDLQDQWDRLLIVTETEFGRTSKENGSKGTDHAQACVMFAAGGRVRGGVYNCDNTTWSAGDLFSSRDRYILRKTDYRAVFAEIFTQHFGLADTLLDQIIPGYDQAAADEPGDFASLDFLRSV